MKKQHLVSEAGMRTVRTLNAVAKARKINLNDVALRYALDRFLFRLFETPESDLANLFFDPASHVSFADTTITVKGGLTMIFAEQVDPFEGRTTGDADLHLAAFPGSMQSYAEILKRGLAGLPPHGEDDGIRFDVDEITVARDRDERSGGSVLVPLQIGNLYLQMKTDVTFDARPMHVRAPVVKYPPVVPELGLKPPSIRRVPFEFMAADKFSATIQGGSTNKRMRDYPDMRLLFVKGLLDPEFLAETIAATLKFKGMPLPASMDDIPGFSDAFAQEKGPRWEVEKKSRNYHVQEPLPEMLANLRRDFAPILARAHELETLPDWAFGKP